MENNNQLEPNYFFGLEKYGKVEQNEKKEGKYYVQTNINMQPKNKAWQELQDFAHEQNGTLIHGDENMRSFIVGVSRKIDEVNAKFPRCTDLSFNTENQYHQVLRAMVYPDEAFSITLLPILKEVL